METWKNHVRARLFQRDQTQKNPYDGVFTSLSQLQERFEIRKQILDQVQTKSLDVGLDGVHHCNRLLYLQLKESEHMTEKLSQTVSDLASVLYLKDAELHYWQSQVSRYRQEALTLANRRKAVKVTLSECEYTVERQLKELAALRAEQTQLREGLAEALREKDELLQRWMDEKREEADRVNKYNDSQERWHRLAKRLNKHLKKEMGRHSELIAINSSNDETEASSSSAIQKNNNAVETQ